MKVGTRARRNRDQRVSVWAWTPSVPLMTKMATSMAAMARSVSPDRSAWPGVSSSVNSSWSVLIRACLEKMVMPRSRSRAWVSKKVSRWSTRPSLRRAPARYNSASDRVVFPASTWARIPAVSFFVVLGSFMLQRYRTKGARYSALISLSSLRPSI